MLAAHGLPPTGSKVDVNGWLEAFTVHPAIGTTSSSISKSASRASLTTVPNSVIGCAMSCSMVSASATDTLTSAADERNHNSFISNGTLL
ncbi:hypothetical protein E2562_033036 [Oryza meyeriana var. granulata]|uniref:Uncharacterized protein n=1 Tax=Oryza meyeriana var. granulata TaxID=110450 RepID=A0A6G1CW02_9ORYZ|nr:hypothetical protein E2562_033036 [Oryza meyeriana var. granulata]